MLLVCFATGKVFMGNKKEIAESRIPEAQQLHEGESVFTFKKCFQLDRNHIALVGVGIGNRCTRVF